MESKKGRFSFSISDSLKSLASSISSTDVDEEVINDVLDIVEKTSKYPIDSKFTSKEKNNVKRKLSKLDDEKVSNIKHFHDHIESNYSSDSPSPLSKHSITNDILNDLLSQSILESDGTTDSVKKIFIEKAEENKVTERFMDSKEFKSICLRIRKDFSNIEVKGTAIAYGLDSIGSELPSSSNKKKRDFRRSSSEKGI
jgi:hypothetical protein